MKIIPFAAHKKAQEPTKTSYVHKRRKIKPLRECLHESIELDEERMRCKCQDCGKIIHPFWVLLEYADEVRDTERKTKALERAMEEFHRIREEWNLTITEKRRITRAAGYESIERLFGGTAK